MNNQLNLAQKVYLHTCNFRLNYVGLFSSAIAGVAMAVNPHLSTTIDNYVAVAGGVGGLATPLIDRKQIYNKLIKKHGKPYIDANVRLSNDITNYVVVQTIRNFMAALSSYTATKSIYNQDSGNLAASGILTLLTVGMDKLSKNLRDEIEKY